jgi:hypothetical protein
LELPTPFNPLPIIVRLSTHLADPAPDWSVREELDTLHYRDENLGSALILSIPFELFLDLKNSFDQALTLKISLEGAVMLDLGKEFSAEVYERFHQEIQASNSPTFIFEFRLNKQTLLQKYFQNTNQYVFTYLYIFPKAFETLLTRSSLLQIEGLFWKDKADCKVIIIIPSQSIFLSGDYLSIIGGEFTYKYDSVNSVAQNKPETKQTLFERCQDVVKWQDHFVNFLTPYHLYVSPISSADDFITQAIFINFVNLVLLYFADRSISRNKSLITIFNGIQQSVEIKLTMPGERKFDNLVQQIPLLFELFEWAYDPHWNVSDRLPLVQIGMVQSLNASEPEFRYRLLLENIGSIYEGLKWHWKAFIEGKVEEYVRQVQDLEQVVSDAVRAFTEQISLLNKNLLETMLAAVGVVIASFIAFLFSDHFNPVVFQIGIWVYCIYMLIFPMIISLKQQNEQFTAYEEDFEVRRKQFEERLYKEKVEAIIGDHVSKNKARFRNAIYYTRLTYILVIITFFISSIFLPSLISKSIATPLPTQSPAIVAPISTATPDNVSTPKILPSYTSTFLPTETLIPTLNFTITPTP